MNVTRLPTAAAEPVDRHRPDFTAVGFAARLVAGLDALGVEPADRPALVADAAGVTVRTARRYLAGKSKPRDIFDQMMIADQLGLCRSWLLFEHEPKTLAEQERERQFLEAYRANPAWRQKLIDRTLTRMVNGSPLVRRLMDLQDQGQLSADDFLRLAGK